jgi:hypothetical protein
MSDRLVCWPDTPSLTSFETRICRYCTTKALRLLLFVLGFFVRGEGTHWLDEVVRRVYMFLCLADAAETAEDNALVATCRTCLTDSTAWQRDLLTACLFTSLDSSGGSGS